MLGFRENMIELTGRDHYFYSMLNVEIEFKDYKKLPSEITLITFCPKPELERSALKFIIPIDAEKLSIDLYKHKFHLDWDDEAWGYMHWHFANGIYIQCNSEEPITFDVKVYFKDKMK